jgi:hypothetical protein
MSMIIPVPASQTPEAPVVIGSFWTDIDPGYIRETQRIDNTITAPRLRATLIEAAAVVIAALAEWKTTQITAGFTSLPSVPADEIDGISINVHRYNRAIGCLAKALLLERYRDFDSTAKGDKKADQLTDPIEDCRRDSLHAIADIVGRPRLTIELI